MPAYNKTSLLAYLQQQTESYLHKAISEWQMIPHSKFALKPAAEKWSANECLQHLNSYGNYYLPAIEKAINLATKQTTGNNVFNAGWLGNYFTKLMLPTENGLVAKPMKSPKDHVPLTIAESHDVIAAFIEQQEKLLQLLSLSKKIDWNKTRVPISIATFIKLKLGDTFLFLIAHQYRHILQAEKALKTAGISNKPVTIFSLTHGTNN